MAMKKIKRLALMSAATLAVLMGAVTFLPLRAIAGLESPCTYLSDLISTNPLSSDLASTGDDHLRCIKVAIKTTFPNISGAVTPTHTELNFVDGVTSAVQTQMDAKLASASYTAADVLTKLLTVDGAGSGIDADLLDALSSASFAQLSQQNTFSTKQIISAAAPILEFAETGVTANNGKWWFTFDAEGMFIRATDDAYVGQTDFFSVQRTGTTVDSINLAATAVQISGTLEIDNVISPATLAAGNNNDYNPTGLATAAIIRLTGDVGGSTITGLAGGTAGRVITLMNINNTSSFSVARESASSAAANRFAVANSPTTIAQYSSMTFWYDGTSSLWRPMAQ